jgi:hypothetical protein
VDAEYMLKPLKERAAVTAVTKDFYERCVKLQLGSPTDPTAYGRMSDLFGDKQLRDDLLEMEGRPYELLSKKIKAITTSQGNPVAFSLCYLPLGNMGSEAYMPNGPYRDFWKDACARKRIELLDLTDPLEALKVSYYDTSQFDYSYHFNHKGQLLNALVLAHELIRGGSIPMRYPDPGKGSAKKNH